MNKFTGPLTSILNTYSQGPGLMAALETYVATVERNARIAVEANIAQTVCEHLHESEPSGLKCLSCYESERSVRDIMQVEAEIEMSRKNR